MDYISTINASNGRCASALLLDTSYSMKGERIDRLNAGLRVFKELMLQDTVAAGKVDLAIMAFDSEVKVIREFGLVKDFEAPVLDAGSHSRKRVLGKAICEALDRIVARKIEYEENGILFDCPRMFLFTDGASEGESLVFIEEAKKRLGTARKARDIEIFFFTTNEGVDLAEIKEDSELNSMPVEDLDSVFFQYLVKGMTGSCIDFESLRVAEEHRKLEEHRLMETNCGAHLPYQSSNWWMGRSKKVANGKVDKQKAWRVVAASVQGSSHEKTGKPCQDAHKWRILDNDWIVAAVADGAGSAAHSDIGASVAVSHAVRLLSERIAERSRTGTLTAGADTWRSWIRKVLESTVGVVGDVAGAFQKPVREFASTLILMALSPSVTIAAQIGDGCIVVQAEDGAIRALTQPAPSEYANETIFLVSPTAIDSAQFVMQETGVQSVAALSDGLQLLAMQYPAWEPFLPFFKPVFSFVRQQADEQAACAELNSLLMSDRVRTRSDDDITLLLATRFQKDVENLQSESATETYTSEFANNPGPRCACVLLLDTSDYPRGERIEKLNDALRTFKEQLREDRYAGERVDLTIVSCDSEIKMVKDFGLLKEFAPQTLSTGVPTPKRLLGAAICEALDKIEARIAAYRENGLLSYRPRLFLFTDAQPAGEPQENIDEARQRLRAAQISNRITVVPVAVSEDADLTGIGKFAGTTALRLREINFRDLLKRDLDSDHENSLSKNRMEL